jgi:FHA domain
MSVNRCPNPSCEYFNRVLPSNAKVCPMCGTALGNAIASVSPPPLMAGAILPPPPPPVVETPASTPSLDRTQYQPRASSVPSTPIPPAADRIPLLKLVHSSGHEYNLFGEAGFIGRRSPSKQVPPEIDLSGIPGEDIISRHHARVAWDAAQTAYTIVDLSTNGIYLNGTLLTAGVQYRLVNGDTLQLGQENLVNFQVVVL